MQRTFSVLICVYRREAVLFLHSIFAFGASACVVGIAHNSQEYSDEERNKRRPVVSNRNLQTVHNIQKRKGKGDDQQQHHQKQQQQRLLRRREELFFLFVTSKNLPSLTVCQSPDIAKQRVVLLELILDGARRALDLTLCNRRTLPALSNLTFASSFL